MLLDSELLVVIGRIYEAAVAPAGWDELASVLAERFGTDSALVFFDEMAQPGNPLPATVTAPPSSETYDANARRAEMLHSLRSAVTVGPDVMGELGVHRPRDACPFTADDERTMAQLIPHVQRALQIQHRLGTMERERALTLDIVCDLNFGVIVVDMNARVIFSNRVADRALSDATIIVSSAGHLTLKNPDQSAALACLISEAATTPAAGVGTRAVGVIHVERAATDPFPLLIAPIRSARMPVGPRVPSAAIMFADPGETPIAPEAALAAMYHLTCAEAKLLAALAGGEALAEYAKRCGIAIGTARTHLKHVLSKSGHHRQVDLVRSVALSPLLNLRRDLP